MCTRQWTIILVAKLPINRVTSHLFNYNHNLADSASLGKSKNRLFPFVKGTHVPYFVFLYYKLYFLWIYANVITTFFRKWSQQNCLFTLVCISNIFNIWYVFILISNHEIFGKNGQKMNLSFIKLLQIIKVFSYKTEDAIWTSKTFKWTFKKVIAYCSFLAVNRLKVILINMTRIYLVSFRKSLTIWCIKLTSFVL